VIAGLGGDNMADIISRAPWCRDGRTLLLQPMSKAEVLRRALLNRGLEMAEQLARQVESRRLLVSLGGKPAVVC